MEFANHRLSLSTPCGSVYDHCNNVTVKVVACGILICHKQPGRVQMHLELAFIYLVIIPLVCEVSLFA